jgi:hypothetical protein
MEDLFKILEESVQLSERKTEKGRGSKEGRAAIKRTGKTHANPTKSRIVVYKSITDALRNGYMGQKFTTKNADRPYVITKQKWGKDDEQIINGRSAKGFSSKTPFSKVDAYSKRTMMRHAGASKKSKKSKRRR